MVLVYDDCMCTVRDVGLLAAEVEHTGHHEAHRCCQEWRRKGAR